MKLIVCASLLVGSFTFVCPQCTAPQWEGIRQSTTDYLHLHKGDHGLFQEFAAVHYDYENKRSSIQMSTNDAGKMAFYNIVTIYKKGKGVRYTSRYYPFKPCVKENLKEPFEEKCVPDGSRPVGNFFFGGSGVFKVTSYETFTEEMSTTFTVAESGNKTMVPVMEVVKGTLGQYDIFQSVLYKNVTDGIKDENVFDVPHGCVEGRSDLLWLAEDEYPPRGHSIFKF